MFQNYQMTTLLTEFSLNRNPMARILKSESIHDATAPYVVSYSSRGPNHISPDILKVACYSMNGSGIFILVQFHRNLQFMQEINNFTPDNVVITFFFF